MLVKLMIFSSKKKCEWVMEFGIKIFHNLSVNLFLKNVNYASLN